MDQKQHKMPMDSIIAPIAPLPQATFMEYTPLATPQLDLKSIYTMERDRQAGIQEDFRYKQKQKLNIIGDIGKQQSDLYQASMASENPYQKRVMDELYNSYSEATNNISNLLNDDFDPVAISKQMLQLQGSFISNKEYKNAVGQQLRYKRIADAITKNPEKYNPYKINKFMEDYINYDGNGVDPTLSFTLSGATMYNMDADYKWISDLLPTQQTEVEDGVLGYEYAKEDDITNRINQRWDQVGQFSGLSEYEWKENLFNAYYSGGGFIKRDDGSIYRVMKDAYKNNDGSRSTQTTPSGDDKLALYKATEINPSLFGTTINQDKAGEYQDGMYSGVYNKGAEFLEKQEFYKDQLHETLKGYQLDKKALVEELYKISKQPNRSEEQQNRIDELSSLIDDINKQIDIVNKTIKGAVRTDEAYKVYGDNIVSGRTKSQITIGPLNKLIDKYKGTNSVYKILEPLKVEYQNTYGGSKYKTIKQILDEIDKLRKENPKNASVLAALKDIEDGIVKLAPSKSYTNLENSGGATYNVNSFKVDNDDKDYKLAISTYENDGFSAKAIENKSGGLYDMSTKEKVKLETKNAKDEEKINFTGITFNNKLGEFGISGSMGTPELEGDDSNKHIITKDGKYQFKDKVRDVWIKDDNINTSTLKSLYQGDDYLALLAGNILPAIYGKIRVRKGLSTNIEIGNTIYKLTNDGDGKVKISKGGVEVSFNGDSSIEDFKVPYAIAEDQAGSITSQQSASGGGRSYTPTFGGGSYNSFSTGSQGGAVNAVGKGISDGSNMSFKELVKSIESPDAHGDKEYAATHTNSNGSVDIGKYQLNTVAQRNGMMEFAQNNNSLIAEGYKSAWDIQNRFSSDFLRFKSMVNNGLPANKKLSTDQLIASYQMYNSPKLQEGYMDYLESSYIANKDRVKDAYAKKGITLNDHQAMYLIHNRGLGGALQGREISDKLLSKLNFQQNQTVNTNFKWTFQKKEAEKEFDLVSPYTKKIASRFVAATGIDEYFGNGMDISSAKSARPSNPNSYHPKGKAIDLKFKSMKMEMAALQKIANLFTNQEETYRKLLSSKYVELPSQDGKNKVRILYHADDDGSGKHIHLEIL